MTNIKLDERIDEDGNIIVFVELLPVEPDENFDWEPILIDLASSDKKTIFIINEFDEIGIDHCILNSWLEHSDQLFIKTSNPHVKFVLNELYNNIEYC